MLLTLLLAFAPAHAAKTCLVEIPAPVCREDVGTCTITFTIKTPDFTCVYGYSVVSGPFVASAELANPSVMELDTIQAVSGTLTWLPGDPATRSVSVPVIYYAGVQGDRSFTVKLYGESREHAGAGDSAYTTDSYQISGWPVIHLGHPPKPGIGRIPGVIHEVDTYDTLAEPLGGPVLESPVLEAMQPELDTTIQLDTPLLQ